MNKTLDRIKGYAFSQTGKKFASGVLWSFIGSAASKFLVLVAGILVARLLGKEGFGEFGMVRSTINMFIILGSSGLGLTATKYISDYRESEQEKVYPTYLIIKRAGIFLGGLLSLLMVISAGFIAEKALSKSELEYSLQLGSILLFFTIINSVQNGVLGGFTLFKSIAINTFWGGVAEAGLMILGGHLYGVPGTILGFGAGFLVIYILNSITVGKTIKEYRSCSRQGYVDKTQLLAKYAFPATLSSIMVIPSFWIVKSFLVRTTGFSELASFEVAEQWRTIILFIPTAISQVILPFLAKTKTVEGATDNQKFWVALKINLLLNLGLTLAFSLVATIMSPTILAFYGNEYHNTSPLVILCASTIPTSCASVVGLSIASQAKMWTGFLFNLLWAGLFIFFSIYFIKEGLGATGLSLAVLISYTTHTILQLIYLKRTTPKR